ncbi:hypothetical protein AAG570_007791 [Ranatra chinensis]|uniref:Uncharacterized protein n=1 Tax=Ranatra chinensis TaxID=642074 RepID=A0ABD0XUT1_9HEMI
MASKCRNMFYENNKQETTKISTLETVETLVRTHPELIAQYSSRLSATGVPLQHTPLHMASRNGHNLLTEATHWRHSLKKWTLLHEEITRPTSFKSAWRVFTDGLRKIGRIPGDWGEFFKFAVKGFEFIVKDLSDCGDIEKTPPYLESRIHRLTPGNGKASGTLAKNKIITCRRAAPGNGNCMSFPLYQDYGGPALFRTVLTDSGTYFLDAPRTDPMLKFGIVATDGI